jgi:MYXO-CTERM domain-containing protein
VHENRVALIAWVYCMVPAVAVADPDIRTVPASSRFVDVTDGDELFREEWIVGSGTVADPQVYVPVRSEEPKSVSFTTDRGSIAFDTLPGAAYTFAIDRGDERVYTRIDRATGGRPTLKHGLVATRSASTPTTIPFSMDEDHGIRIQGSINGSSLLDLAFDTGAKRVYVVRERLDAKVKLAFTGNVADVGSDGISQAAVSSGNRLAIGDLSWTDVDLVASPIGKADGIVGWSVFENKLIEIDYDRMVMVIHDTVASVPPGYAKQELRTYSGSPFVEATITAEGQVFTDWFLFDSGFNERLYVSNRLATQHGLAGRGGGDTMVSSAQKPVAVKKLAVSKVQIGRWSVDNVSASVNVGGPEEVPHNDILGNALLSQFNVVLDIQHGAIYLRARTPTIKARTSKGCGCTSAPDPSGLAVLALLAACRILNRRRLARAIGDA